jgi:hypothetical protein
LELEEETELTETRYEREKRKRAQRKAQEQQDIETAFARRHEIVKKDSLNSGLTMMDDMMAFKKKRYAQLVAKTQNRYNWIAALHQQKKYKEKSKWSDQLNSQARRSFCQRTPPSTTRNVCE